MKTRFIVLLGVVALITLSFTFVSVSKNDSTAEQVSKKTVSEPAGGFALEDKL